MKQTLTLIFIVYAQLNLVHAQNWLTTGNSGTDPTINFLGTTDNKGLALRTKNIERIRITTIGNTGIGNSNPQQKLDVKGNINIGSGFALYMENHRVLRVDSVNQNIFLGNGVAANNSTGFYNTASGYNALSFNTSGNSNVAIGIKALYNNVSRSNLVAVGDSALYNNGVGAQFSYVAIKNTAVGSKALYANTIGSSNTASGSQALYLNTTGGANTATGAEALYSSTAGSNNTANGNQALYSNTTGGANTAIGAYSLYSNTTGDYNTANGISVLYSNTSGYDNTAVGTFALSANTTGTYNTALGISADVASGNLTNATAIGSSAIVNASNKVRVGNTIVTSIGGQVGWSVFSDGRYKKNVKEDVKGLSFINSLRPITYTVDINGLNAYYDKGRKHDDAYEKMKADMQPAADEASKIVYNGFIAQDVEAAAKKLNYDFSGVDKPQTENGLYGLRYAEFVVPLVKAVQELSEQNEALRKKYETLQKQIDELKTLMISQNKENATDRSQTASNQ